MIEISHAFLRALRAAAWAEGFKACNEDFWAENPYEEES